MAVFKPAHEMPSCAWACTGIDGPEQFAVDILTEPTLAAVRASVRGDFSRAAGFQQFPVKQVGLESIVGILQIPVGESFMFLVEKFRPKQIRERVHIHLRAQKRRCQPEIFHMGDKIALDFPVSVRPPGRIGFRGEDDPAAGIENLLEQPITVVRKPPPVGFAIVNDMLRRAMDIQMMPQVLDRFEFYLPYTAVVSINGQRMFPPRTIKVQGLIAFPAPGGKGLRQAPRRRARQGPPVSCSGPW